MKRHDVFPVIMAGGSGTRFWPLSRKALPKQFLALSTKRPLITETLARIGELASSANAFVVCGAVHAPLVRKSLKVLKPAQVLVEPEARNTAPAIALATAQVARKDPNGIVVVMPSDQHVADVPAFTSALEAAIDVAAQGSIVTLGIRPTRPETGYGYIQVGDPLTTGLANKVARFVEKPDRQTAEQYLVSGNYVWNAGIFVFQARVMLEAFAQHMPDLFSALEALKPALGTKREKAALAKHFKKMPATSIDYGIAERASNIAVVPVDCGWSDVGSFNALPEVRPTDAAGNVLVGERTMAVDSAGCVIWATSAKRVVAAVGVKDLVIVETPDAILVLPKEKSQDVRKVVEALKAAKATQFL